ncbi:hypothetical protein [Peribacillus butanolivorans]|uniref:hypothetical protein n=1 Tax=Peribacillus butanolivorans TaxID=421767 RepID=UPI003BF4E2C2
MEKRNLSNGNMIIMTNKSVVISSKPMTIRESMKHIRESDRVLQPYHGFQLKS